MSRSLALLAAGAACSVAVDAEGSFLLIPNSTTDQVVLLDAFDGTVLNTSFLDIATQATNAGVNSTPIEVLNVGNELWVSDQVADRIWRFGQNGGYLGDIGAGQLDNIRGMEVVGNTVYVAQGGSGGLGEGVTTIDVPSLTITGNFGGAVPDDISLYDVFDYNGELLVTNIDSGNDAIQRYDYAGNFLGDFATSDGLSDFDFLQQLAERGSNGNLLGGGFSVPSGVFEWQSDGTALGIVAGLDRGPRGVFELGNGDVLWTNGNSISTDSVDLLTGGGFRYITQTDVPAPGALALLGLAGIAGRRRRL